VPGSKALNRDEALAELAKRYFVSHGPATIKDYAWWSGLSLRDARAGVEMVKSDLTNIDINNQTYWFSALSKVPKSNTTNVHYLPAYDELTVGYTDRSAVIDNKKGGRAIPALVNLNPVILSNSHIMGNWRRTIKKDVVEIENLYFPGYLKKPDISQALKKFEFFFGKKILVKEKMNN